MSGIVGANFLKESGVKRSHKFQRFTATGASTWVKPSGITTVCVEVIAGGGGGGGATGDNVSDAGAGGAGGASLTRGTYNAVSLPSTLTITVGGWWSRRGWCCRFLC